MSSDPRDSIDIEAALAQGAAAPLAALEPVALAPAAAPPAGVLRKLTAPALRLLMPLARRTRHFFGAELRTELLGQQAQVRRELAAVHAALVHKSLHLHREQLAAQQQLADEQRLMFSAVLASVERQRPAPAHAMPAGLTEQSAPGASAGHAQVKSNNTHMKPAIIMVGGGGHAKVCIELLQAAGETVAYCIAGADGGEHCLGVPILAGDHHLALLREQGYGRAFIAIGANRVRVKLGALAREAGYELVNAISPRAVVSPSAQLGQGIAVMAGAVINAEARIGDLAIINTGATVDHECHIGAGVHLAPQCALAGNVSVGDGSFLGIGCKVIPEVQIGAQVTVGAGGVVITGLPSGTTAVGVPARPIKSIP